MFSALAVVNQEQKEIPNTNEVNITEDENSLLFPISREKAQTLEEKNIPAPIDLKNPENIKSTIEYDAEQGHYIFRTKIGDQDISSPYVLNSEEYKEYSMQQSMQKYWKQKNNLNKEQHGENHNSLTDIKFDLGPADDIFGPGGVQVKTQGSAELSFGFKKNRIDNPTLSERSRNPPPSFDFDEKIQLSVKGSVGDKINLGMNYNTEASFDFDQKLIKLGYQGKEDEIIQKLEAGNVSMPLSGSLITGSSALFGIKTQLKFGRLTIDAVISQQESEKQTVSLKNGSQTTPFEIAIDKYDENRHFFLSHYFRDNYDKAMSTLPYINSAVKINRVEVWITNKRGNYEQSRNIIAFADLAEAKKISNEYWTSSNPEAYPSNKANSLYYQLTDTTTFVHNGYNIRNIDGVNEVLEHYLGSQDIVGGEDYEKIESARMLNSSEYSINPQLGYISLRSALNADEVIAVAYEFTAGGMVYQVGEFSTDNIKAPNALVVKMLKGTNLSPKAPTWDLMMKNIYSLGAFQIQAEKFELNIMYQSDSTGIYLNHIPGTPIADKTLLTVMNLDRLDTHNESRPDGKFDYLENFTVLSSTGRIIFPTVEPFGTNLYKKLGNDPALQKFVYQELYDSTLTVAQSYSEKNKFKLTGKYKGASGSEIRLNAMNVPRGSVTVTAGGIKLTENVDYTVDYTMGTVNILNNALLESGTSINVSLENQSYFSTQRKTLLGTHLDYKFNNDFNIGGTLMYLYEKPLTQKVSMGNEPISNTMFGLNSSYKKETQWLTNMLDKLPLLKLKEPSSITFNGEFAQIVPGHSKVIKNYAYIDDFESTKTGIDIRHPYNWKLASTPGDEALFPESKRSNDVSYGQNRALLSWYTIDPIFTRNNNNTPSHIRNDADQLSNHFVREIKEQEIFPNREAIYGQSSYLSILNLAYYPEERGPYNLDAFGFSPDGKLTNPQSRWGGIMRKLETTDFETANIEYIEFWMMDPFIYNEDNTMTGGDLYFNLGNISEDILKDGKKSFESGLPTDGDMSKVTETVWGRVPKIQSMVYAFQNEGRRAQDVGLDGLSDTDEQEFGAYKEFVTNLRSVLSASALQEMEEDKYSPLNDPAGDNYHYFRGSDFDRNEISVLDRYKRYNGMENNSPASDYSPESYSTASSSTPDVEDINQDNTLNEYERFFQYRLEIRPEKMVVGSNFITDKVTSNVDLPNGKTEAVSWYQFKVPIREYEKKVGSINDFKSIRFVRLFLTNFEEETHLRFGSMELVRGEWRNYEKDVRYDISETPISTAQLDVSAVNIEENANKQPIRYILPPGVSRVIDPSQTQVRQENEQSMLLKVNNLAPKDARAVYKNIGMDMRQYKRLQMFVHAEKLIDDVTDLKDYELTAFIRLGSDHTNNFYEYEIPLTLTPHKAYNPNVKGDDELIWPENNMFNFAFDKLTDVKTERNRLRDLGNSNVSLSKPFYKYDEEKPLNKITIVGNPNIGDVQVVMIGIRNQSNEIKEGEVWVNELRLSEFNEKGGYAALANMTINLSDFGSVNVSGRTETSGFGGIEQNVMERNIDDYYQFNLATALELGKFFPEKTKVRIPMYYSYSKDVISPKYNPLDQDIELNDLIKNAENKEVRDSIKKMSQDVSINKSISFTNVKIDKQSKTPQLYDPTNFSVGYAYNELENYDPETEYEITKNYKGNINYNFNTNPKPYEPFKNVKAFNKKAFALVRDFNINYMPSYISYNNQISRYYYELKTKDLTQNNTSSDPTSFSQDFTWRRNFDIKYDLTRALKFTFSSATNSRIDEPYQPVNKEIYPDEYEHWKDSVWSNVVKGGRAVQYQQQFTANYSVPMNKIPILNWTTVNAQYNSTYNWEKGVNTTITDENEETSTISVGNIANNTTTWQIDSRLNFETLYKKSPYLNGVENKFTKRQTATKPQPKKYTEKVSIKKGDEKVIRHRLGSKKLDVTITDEKGKSLTIRHKIVDENSIKINAKEDLEKININITSIIKPENVISNGIKYIAKGLMMVRNISGNYKETNSLILPNFQPESGLLGQDNYENTKAPGYDFVFGIYDNEDYIDKTIKNNWITFNNSISNPISINKSTELQLRSTIEPIVGLKIDLNASRMTSEAQSIEYFTDNFGNLNQKTYLTGTFSMTQMAVGTLLWKIGSNANYDSEAYQNFLDYRQKMANRLEQEYINNGYNTYEGYSLNSADVMIPAFLAAYTNKDADKSNMDLFPSIKNLMPNWRMSYNGLAKIKQIKKYFKSVNLNHAYRCTYNVGSYSNYMNWEAGPNNTYGYISDVLDESGNNRILSSNYDVAAVTITESFSPLFGVDVTTNNNITFKIEYKKSRTLNLNISSTQLIESTNDEWVIGGGYKIKDFNTIIKIQQKQSKVKNDLTLRADLSFKDVKVLIRKIEEEYSQPTSGNKALSLKMTADYVFSEKVNIGLYFDRMTNTPIISSSYPTASTNFGVTFKFLLTR